MTQTLLVIDAGTTSTRAMLFGVDGTRRGCAHRQVTQYFPAPGLVEHDARELWSHTLACVREMVGKAGGYARVAGIGIANQRETIVFWDRRSGEPLAPAIVWQDRRTAVVCEALKQSGHEADLQSKTGLLLDPYFSASKIAWALEHWPQLRAAGDGLAMGTVDSYLVFRLTGGMHLTDATNASRTALMSISTGQWDDELCELFVVPRKLLPEIVDSAGQFGSTQSALFGGPIQICGIAGDQQAAAIGQACVEAGQTKATFGTGAFVLTHTGVHRPRSKHRLLTTVAYQLGGTRSYALEGSVFSAGSLVQWLRDGLGLIQNSSETEMLARSVSDNGGVYLVPALSGLGAPHWRPTARGTIYGLSYAAKKAHIVRAALEAVAYQIYDLKLAFAGDGAIWAGLRIDGGLAANDWVTQDLADILDINVERPRFIETTALGAAMLAGVGAGLYRFLADALVMRGEVQRFSPQLTTPTRQQRLSGWSDALARVLL